MTTTMKSDSVTLERRNGYYEIDGEFYPSVTTILQVISKPALMSWYGKLGTEEANRIKQESADFGKTVHDLIRVVLSGGTVDYDTTDPVVGGCLRSFEEWVRLVEFQPVLTEHTIHSKVHGFAGTLDALGLVYGVPTLIDWKTSSGVYDEMTLQVAAYDVAVREMQLGQPLMKLIVRFDKKTKACHPTSVDASEAAFGAFLNAKQLWMWLQEAKSRPGAKRANGAGGT